MLVGTLTCAVDQGVGAERHGRARLLELRVGEVELDVPGDHRGGLIPHPEAVAPRAGGVGERMQCLRPCRVRAGVLIGELPRCDRVAEHVPAHVLQRVAVGGCLHVPERVLGVAILQWVVLQQLDRGLALASERSGARAGDVRGRVACRPVDSLVVDGDVEGVTPLSRPGSPRACSGSGRSSGRPERHSG